MNRNWQKKSFVHYYGIEKEVRTREAPGAGSSSAQTKPVVHYSDYSYLPTATAKMEKLKPGGAAEDLNKSILLKIHIQSARTERKLFCKPDQSARFKHLCGFAGFNGDADIQANLLT